jgi:DNA-binding response OmpR family regulator
MRGLSVSAGRPQGIPEHPFFIYPEDDAATIALVRAALRKLKAEDTLIHCPEGEAAMQCVRDCLISRHYPRFILLSAGEGHPSGFEMLKWIRSLPDLRGLPVMIMSSSPSADEVDLSIVFGATNYLVTPATYEGFCTILHDLLTRFMDPAGTNSP